jgi:hypothetical protein
VRGPSLFFGDGFGESKRELYTTDSEYAFKVKRPVIVNGINVPSDRADLLSRFVAIEVPPISEEERISEAEFRASFERERGKLLGAFFDILSGVLRNRKPVDWRPRMPNWGELASALYDYMGWGRDLFKLDHDQVELKQHEAALESVVGEALLKYLYAEFDDGKAELVLPKADLWLEAKLRVEPESRRWFPQSSAAFGKELSRLKQALAAKGFEVSDGLIGRGNTKKRVAKITRVDEAGTAGYSWVQEQNESAVPKNSLQMPEKNEGGYRRTADSPSFLVNKNKKI